MEKVGRLERDLSETVSIHSFDQAAFPFSLDQTIAEICFSLARGLLLQDLSAPTWRRALLLELLLIGLTLIGEHLRRIWRRVALLLEMPLWQRPRLSLFFSCIVALHIYINAYLKERVAPACRLTDSEIGC